MNETPVGYQLAIRIAEARNTATVIQRARATVQGAPSASAAAFEVVRDDTVRRVLSEIDVEQIKTVTQGRVSLDPLRAAGIRRVDQLLGMGEMALQRLPGIGPVNARKIAAAAHQLADTAKHNVTVRMDLKGRPEAQRALLEAVRRQDQIERLCPDGEAAFAAGDRLTTLAQAAELQTKGAVRRFFAGGAKRQAAEQAARDLVILLDSVALKDANEVAALVNRAVVPQGDVWNDFITRAADYFHHLTDLGVEDADAKAAVGHLPAHVVEAVRRQPLDDSLLQVRLRGYQAFGARYALVQRKTLLGDEMGLGKTIQALAAIAHLTAQGERHFLVVCPTAVVANWVSEIRRKSRMEAVLVHGADRRAEMERWRTRGGVAVVSYETARGGVDGLLRAVQPTDGTEGSRLALLVVDEAHYVKNPTAMRSRAVRRLTEAAERVLFMSGTPLENRLAEMQTLIGYLQPEIAVALRGTVKAAAIVAPDVFREHVAPVYLRRNQDDVLAELPEKIESDEWISIGSAEYSDYRDAVLAGQFMTMRRAVTAPASADLVDPENLTSKLERLLEIVEEAATQGRKVLVFSFFRPVIEAVARFLPDAFGPIHGGVSGMVRQQLVDAFTDAPGAAVLVSQIQAGGTGLNIQAASVVVLMEPQVKPSLEEQAIARAHRMGQARPVQVFRLLAENTVDERMVEILATKGAEFDMYARESSVTAAAPEASDVSDVALATEVVKAEQLRIAREDRE